MRSAPKPRCVFDGWENNAVARLPFAEGDAAAKLTTARHTLAGEIFIQRYQTTPMETRGYGSAWSPTADSPCTPRRRTRTRCARTLAQVLGNRPSTTCG